MPLEHPGRDRTRGRIWRITYDGVTSPSPQLSSASVSQLLDALGHPNLKVRMAAMDQITDRIGDDAIVSLQQLITSSTNPAQLACAQWCLFRLGQQDVDSLVASLVPSQPEPLRLHSLRTLAEIPLGPKRYPLKLPKRCQNDTARAQALAAEALGLHPSISHAKSLVERLISGQEFDPALRHTIRIALRNQLRDTSTANQIVQQTWSAKELSVLSDVAVAVPNSAAASVCLQALLSEAPLNDQDRQRLVAHVAQYLSGDELNAAVSALRKFSSDDIDFQLVLLERLAKSDQIHPEVSAWALDVIRRALADHFRNDNVWETDNPTLWGFENRNSTDGRVLSMFSSLAGGETSTGTVESPKFACPSEIRFWLCGHRNVPDKPASDRNYIALIDSQGTAIRQAFPPRSDTARQVTWDTSDLAGQMVSLRIVDGETASAYAWLAIGELDESLPALPTADFAQDHGRLVAAVTLADSLNDLDEAMQNDLQTLFRSLGTAKPLRHRLAGILSRQFGNSPMANILLDIAADNSAAEQWRDTLQNAFSERCSSEQIQHLASEFAKTLPARLQQRLAVSLSSSMEGQQLLLELVQQGNIAAATLNDPTVRSQIQASSAREIRETAQQMIDQLPTTDDKLLAQVARWQKQASLTTEQADADSGKQIFTKNCAICHQFLGEGALIGPQLDGVKNRGIERMTEDILLPNRNVDAAFRVTLVTLHDGRVLSGVFRRMEGDSVIYANQKGEEFQVRQNDIEEQQLLPQSLMPANFHEVLKRREFVDLIHYLQTSK
ncbi:MAG: c-type cytochrome [Pirellulaceae bacterium]